MSIIQGGWRRWWLSGKKFRNVHIAQNWSHASQVGWPSSSLGTPTSVFSCSFLLSSYFFSQFLSFFIIFFSPYSPLCHTSPSSLGSLHPHQYLLEPPNHSLSFKAFHIVHKLLLNVIIVKL